MKKKSFFFSLKLALLLVPAIAASQTMPVSLRSDVSVQFIMNVNEKCSRLAKDPVSGDLFYTTSTGNVYQVKNLNTSPYDVLVYTPADHGISFLQGITFIDSSMFLIGNAPVDSTQNIGLIQKAVLQPSGSRSWFNVASTGNYAQSFTWYDHGFSGIVVSPDSNYLFISSGSRTDHGEEQNNYGLYPGLREEPLTSAIFRIPANSANLVLPNNAALLSPYLFADGTRNSFDMAFDSNDNLFATENSGDRDDPDELNWIRQGKHYGFPWILGGDNNPQQFAGYNPNTDALLNHNSNCYLNGYYYNDPAFPSPAGISFTPAVKNMGPDADKYRETSGQINDGSTSGNYLHTFSPHRCPLGLNFDRKNILASDLKGDGFLVCFTIGADSSGLDPYGNIGALCDPGQDLLHIELSPDGSGEYQMTATSIINNFLNPVDTYMDQNVLYIIEYSYMGPGRLFKITLPLDPASVEEKSKTENISIYPNPSSGIFAINFQTKITKTKIYVYDVLGNCVLSKVCGHDMNQLIDLSAQPKGIYFVQFSTGEKTVSKKIVLH